MYLIYGRPNCKYCVAAIGMAERSGVSYEYFDISKDEYAYEQIVDVWGFKTVPQIFYSDESTSRHIGGFDSFRDELRVFQAKKDVSENGT